ncbi:hypothetical protein [Variovorax saccharolyticus]|uniref:hypothetical protein n=1 Tax=Variovorax saccharolyticus TaxID=3053516 RepID=UPI002576EC45|nr:hypothetical protein [Variovorax sp. J22R187]MDM0017399.1 hypothetical protein [Variovorax sp. J22R187]
MSRQSTNFGPYEHEYRQRVSRPQHLAKLGLQAAAMAATVIVAGVFVFPMDPDARQAIVQNQPAGIVPSSTEEECNEQGTAPVRKVVSPRPLGGGDCVRQLPGRAR